MADARDSKSRGGNTVSVQVRLPAPDSSFIRTVSMNDACVFCKIVNNQLSTFLIDFNDSCVVIQDIAPKAPIHYLVVSKEHIPTISSLEQSHEYAIVSEMIKMIQVVTAKKNIKDFRLVINNGRQAGQTVFHLHIHILSGSSIPGMMSDVL